MTFPLVVLAATSIINIKKTCSYVGNDNKENKRNS
jgi:hypothetical protein